MERQRGLGKATVFRWVVLGLIFLIYTIATADRANIGLALPFIRKDFPMTNTQAGALMSVFFIGYVVAMIPGGFLCAKYGVKRVLTVFVILTSVFTGLIGFAGSVLQIKLCRLGVGMAEGPVAVGMATTINNWFPPREKGLATGFFLASSQFGPLIVPPLSGLIISYFGWRQIFWSFAIPGIIFSLVWFLLVNDQPGKSRFCSPAELELIRTDKLVVGDRVRAPKPYRLWWLDRIIRARRIEPIDSTAKLFRSWNLIGCAMGYFFIIALTTILMSWIPTYLITVKKFAIMKMAFASAAPFGGLVLGNLVGGWLSDNVLGKRRKPLMMLTALITSGLMYSLIYSSEQPLLLGTLLFVLGFLLALGFSAFIVYPMGLVAKPQFPVAFGIINVGGQLGGFCAPLAVGMILDKYNWNVVFMAMAACCILCFLLVVTIVEPVDQPVSRPLPVAR
jgi:sugar phosphate permease